MTVGPRKKKEIDERDMDGPIFPLSVSQFKILWSALSIIEGFEYPYG